MNTFRVSAVFRGHTMIRILLPVSVWVFVLLLPLGAAIAGEEQDQVLQVVADMNAAWDDQDAAATLTYFAEDVDFENSFGWTVRDRDSMGRFLEWLFARYPKPEGEAPPVESKTAASAEILGAGVALVDSVRIIGPATDERPARSIRTTHVLQREDGRWLISKTRIWDQRPSSVTPTELVAPSRFNESAFD